MDLTIQLPHASDADSLHAHADRVLRFALSRFSTAITRVRLRLVDVNGPRGGTDQECRVQIALRDGATVHVEGVDGDARTAIHLVAARAARTVGRQVARVRSRRAMEPRL